MSINWQTDASPAPALLVLPPDVSSLDEAHAAIELWEHYSGKSLDPTQRLTVEVMMATGADGLWAASTTGREMPRQNGKGDEVEVVELWGLVQRGEAILHTVHDAVLLASQAQQRMLAVLDRPDLRVKKKRQWLGTGQQMIEMRNGGIIWYRTRTNGGGRGVDDVSRLVIDEAQHATEEHLAAVSPTLQVNENPQMNVLGTSGLEGKSDWWWSNRIRALTAEPGRFGYVGHTAEVGLHLDGGRVVQPEVDPTDRGLWAGPNPILIRRPELWAFFEEELQRLGPVRFGQEHLGIWDPPPQDGGSEIDMDAWVRLEQTTGEKPSPVAFGLEVSRDRKWTTIGMAGAVTDGRYVGVVKSLRGVDGQVAEKLLELQKEWEPLAVALDPSGMAGSLVADLEAAGIELTPVSGRDLAQSTGMVFDGVADGTLRHSSQRLLNMSIGGARTRPSSNARVWDLRGDIDVAPLQAASIALFALGTAKPAKQRSGKVW